METLVPLHTRGSTGSLSSGLSAGPLWGHASHMTREGITLARTEKLNDGSESWEPDSSVSSVKKQAKSLLLTTKEGSLL